MAAECKIPLPRPIKLGPVEIKTRDFVVLRLKAEDESFGDAIGYPRGTALFESLRLLSRRIIGWEVSERRAFSEHTLSSLVNGRPTFIRATSLIDIALWDIAAKSADQPLFRLLGGSRSKVPVMAVGGYYLQERSIEDVCDEIRGLVDSGHQRVKIMLSGADPGFDERYVDAVSRVSEGRLGADAHWSWCSIAEAIRTCSLIDDVGLLFIEDPFGAYQWPLAFQLQSHLKTPVAMGEDMPDNVSLFGLTDRLSVLRVDATTCGGIGPATDVIAAATLRGAAVLPHVFGQVHAQLAGAYSGIEAIEYIPQSTGADPLSLILRRNLKIEDGVLAIDEEPGAGIEVNWPEVRRFQVNAFEVDE
jgi:L-alanine-DL-glutamate epimerase-like enolase superfamily enzyme